VFIMIMNVTALLFGSQPQSLGSFWRNDSFQILGANLSLAQTLLFGTALLVACVLFGLGYMTASGLRYRALVANRELATLLGFPVERMLVAAGSIGALIGGLGSLLTAVDTQLVLSGGFTQLLGGVACALIAGNQHPGKLAAASTALSLTYIVVGLVLGFIWVDLVTYMAILVAIGVRNRSTSGPRFWDSESSRLPIRT
jgi:branched-chain amino acid transport system permease protein